MLSLGDITIKGLYTDNVSIIGKLVSQLASMNEQFDAEGKVTMEVSIYRIDQVVGDIGKGFAAFLFLFANVDLPFSRQEDRTAATRYAQDHRGA